MKTFLDICPECNNTNVPENGICTECGYDQITDKALYYPDDYEPYWE